MEFYSRSVDWCILSGTSATIWPRGHHPLLCLSVVDINYYFHPHVSQASCLSLACQIFDWIHNFHQTVLIVCLLICQSTGQQGDFPTASNIHYAYLLHSPPALKGLDATCWESFTLDPYAHSAFILKSIFYSVWTRTSYGALGWVSAKLYVLRDFQCRHSHSNYGCSNLDWSRSEGCGVDGGSD